VDLSRRFVARLPRASGPQGSSNRHAGGRLLDLTNRGDIAIDPFLGSGSTLIAADKTGRVCRGVELDPLYVDVIVRRYESATGNPTVFVETRRLRRWQHGGRRSRRRIKSGFDVNRTLRTWGATSHSGAEGPLAQRRGLGLRAYKLPQGWVSALLRARGD
jgi:hypothetical protein